MRYAVPALRFKTCRLLSGNVWKKELTTIQRRILRKLRKKKRNLKKRIYPRKNRNNYIQLQTTRKLPLFHGNLPMQRGGKRIGYIPFLLNLERRLDVIPVRLHFCETLPQARQPISHRKVCVNNGIVNMTHLKVSHGDIISFQENEVITRRSLYLKMVKIIGKLMGYRGRMCRRTQKGLLRLLKTQKGCRRLAKAPFLKELCSSMQYLEGRKRSAKVCLGSYFAQHNRMKRNFYHFKFFSKDREKKRRTKRSPFKSLSLLFSKDREKKRSIPSYGPPLEAWKEKKTSYGSPLEALSFLFSRKREKKKMKYRHFFYFSESSMKRRKRIELPTHYLEVNHRALKAVVSYGPKIDHIPHDIRLKDPNLLLRSVNGRGQNI